jgi:transcriptional regulator with XRE-family HTH domain
MRTTHGVEIKVRRIRAGLYQYELAARLGINQTKLSEIECGRVQPSSELLERILDAIRRAKDAKVQR